MVGELKAKCNLAGPLHVEFGEYLKKKELFATYKRALQ